MAATTNLFIDQGSDFIAEIDLMQDNGDPMNLAGANVASQMRRSHYSVTAHSFECSVLDAANGTIKLQMLANVSSNIRSGRYVYDVELQQEQGKTRVLEGIVTVYPEVTK
jgi:hypothetical protein